MVHQIPLIPLTTLTAKAEIASYVEKPERKVSIDVYSNRARLNVLPSVLTPEPIMLPRVLYREGRPTTHM